MVMYRRKYSVIGELIYQVGAKNQTITSGYRAYGLLYGREETFGAVD